MLSAALLLVIQPPFADQSKDLRTPVAPYAAELQVGLHMSDARCYFHGGPREKEAKTSRGVMNTSLSPFILLLVTLGVAL